MLIKNMDESAWISQECLLFIYLSIISLFIYLNFTGKPLEIGYHIYFTRAT